MQLRALAVFSLSLFHLVAQPLAGGAPQRLAATQQSDPVLLHGRVVDMFGDGVPAATVEVLAADPVETPLAHGTCDGDGAFRINRVPSRLAWSLRATANGKNIGIARVVDAALPTQITVFDALTLRGVLKNHNGQPVAGAQVRGISYLLQGPTDELVTTDAEGRFVLRRLAPGPINVLAAVPGEGLATWYGRLGTDAEIALASRQSEGMSMTVEVRGLTATEAMATCVELAPDNGFPSLPPPWHRPRLDAEGRCALVGLPRLNFTVRLLHATRTFAPDSLLVKAGATAAATFAANSEPALLAYPAVVSTNTGLPVAGLTVALQTTNGAWLTSARSAADGSLTFRCNLANSGAQLEAEDDRWVLDQVKTQGLRGWNDPRYLSIHESSPEARPDVAAPLQLCATRACSVQGSVKRPDGTPANQTCVTLLATVANAAESQTIARTTTDALGQFVVRRLHPGVGTLRIVVRDSQGHGVGDAFAFDTPGHDVQLPTLLLSAPATIRGLVRDQQQNLAPGVRVWLRMAHGTSEVVSDRLGRYCFVGVPEGDASFRLLVSASRHSQGPSIASLTVRSGAHHVLDLTATEQ